MPLQQYPIMHSSVKIWGARGIGWCCLITMHTEVCPAPVIDDKEHNMRPEGAW